MVARVIRSEAATEPSLPSAAAETKNGIATDPAALLINLLREILVFIVLLFQSGFRISGLTGFSICRAVIDEAIVMTADVESSTSPFVFLRIGSAVEGIIPWEFPYVFSVAIPWLQGG